MQNCRDTSNERPPHVLPDDELINKLGKVRWLVAQSINAKSEDDQVFITLDSWNRIISLIRGYTNDINQTRRLWQSIQLKSSDKPSGPNESNFKGISRELFNQLSTIFDSSSSEINVQSEGTSVEVEVSKDRFEPQVVVSCRLGEHGQCSVHRVSARTTVSAIYELAIEQARKNKCINIEEMPNIESIRVRRKLNYNMVVWEDLEDVNVPIGQIALNGSAGLSFEIKVPSADKRQITENLLAAGMKAIPLPPPSPSMVPSDNRGGLDKLTVCPVKISVYKPHITDTRDSNKFISQRRSESQNVKGPSIRGVRGLRNLGNTCFMNSSLQCLSNVPTFRDYFLQLGPADLRKLRAKSPNPQFASRFNCSHKRPCLERGDLTEAFSQLLREMWSPKYGSCDPSDIKSLVSRVSNRFSGYNQHDSQEFMCVLLDLLHEDLLSTGEPIGRFPDNNSAFGPNWPFLKPISSEEIVQLQGKIDSMSNDTSIADTELAELFLQIHMRHGNSYIMQAFQGQIKSTVQCLSCYQYSRTFDPFLFLCLPLGDERHRHIGGSGSPGYPHHHHHHRHHHNKSLYRSQGLPSIHCHPSMKDTQLIVFAVLITMDGLIHSVAICIPRDQQSTSRQPKTSVLSDSRNRFGKQGANNGGTIEKMDEDEYSDAMEEDGSSSGEHDTLNASILKLSIRDLLNAAEQSTIFVNSKSAQPMPRLELLEAVLPDGTPVYEDNIGTAPPKDTYFRRVLPYRELFSYVPDFVVYDGSSEVDSDRENLSYARDTKTSECPTIKQCSLLHNIVLCQFPPQSTPANTARSMHALVTLQVQGLGYLYPVAMSMESLGCFFSLGPKQESSVEISNEAKGAGSLHPYISVTMLARRGLQCLDLELSQPICGISPVVGAECDDDMRGYNADVRYFYAELQESSLRPVRENKWILDQLGSAIHPAFSNWAV